MRPRDLKRVVESLYPTRRSVFVWGPPGVGKSDVVRQAAKKLGVDYLDVRLPYHDPGDLRFPLVDQARQAVRFVCPLLPKDPDWRGILALEELPQAAPMTQAAAMQLALDRQVGDHPLSEGTMVVALGNRQEDRAGAHRLLTALANRFIHYSLDLCHEDWQDWALEAEVAAPVRAFLRWKPDLLHRFDPSLNEREFPSPRSWQFASEALAVCPPDLRLETLAGCVGRGPAAELVAFLEIHEALEKRYALDRILARPAEAAVPPISEPAVLWALAGALAEKCRAKARATVQAAMVYVMRWPLEFATYAIRSIVKLGGSLNALGAPGASAFIARHKHVLLAD